MVGAVGACGHGCHHKPSPWGSAAEAPGCVQDALQTAQGVSAGPQPESRGTERGGLPSIRTLPGLLGSVLSDLRGMG